MSEPEQIAVQRKMQNMDTILSSLDKVVTIGENYPTILIGERINPTGKGLLLSALQRGDLSIVEKEAIEQVTAGADMLDVNCAGPGIDEMLMLPRAIDLLQKIVQVPLCIDSSDAGAIEAALVTYRGRALINSVNGDERSLKEILPLAKKYGAAVIALPMTARGIPDTANARVKIAEAIVKEACESGLSHQDVVMDCLATSLAVNGNAALTALETIRLIKDKLGLNITVGASNTSFALPERATVHDAFLAIAINAGVTCPIVDVRKTRLTVLAADLISGRDPFAMRYIRGYREWANKAK